MRLWLRLGLALLLGLGVPGKAAAQSETALRFVRAALEAGAGMDADALTSPVGIETMIPMIEGHADVSRFTDRVIEAVGEDRMAGMSADQRRRFEALMLHTLAELATGLVKIGPTEPFRPSVTSRGPDGAEVTVLVASEHGEVPIFVLVHEAPDGEGVSDLHVGQRLFGGGWLSDRLAITGDAALHHEGGDVGRMISTLERVIGG